MSSLGPAERTLSSGVVVVRREEQSLLYLLLKAYQYWDFPKGQVEPGETPFQAAIREVREETTLTWLDFHWGEIFFETPPYRGGKVARYYIAQTGISEIELPVNPELGRPEHQDFAWVRFRQACTMVSPRVRQVLDWADAIIAAEPFE